MTCPDRDTCPLPCDGCPPVYPDLEWERVWREELEAGRPFRVPFSAIAKIEVPTGFPRGVMIWYPDKEAKDMEPTVTMTDGGEVPGCIHALKCTLIRAAASLFAGDTATGTCRECEDFRTCYAYDIRGRSP